MWCLRYGNGGRMHVILNGEPLEEVDCLSTWSRKWQLMEDVKGMWYTMNEGYIFYTVGSAEKSPGARLSSSLNVKKWSSTNETES